GNLLGQATGAWLPGQSTVPGQYAQPQWRITVTNHGPDTSYGPFEFPDALTLPAGVTVGAPGTWSAIRYSGPGGTTGTTLAISGVSGTGTAGDASSCDVGDDTTFLATGDDRIALIANVAVAQSATGTVSNTAAVVAQTYERADNMP